MASEKRRLALVGARGMLAQKVRSLAPSHWEVVCLSHPEFDLTDIAGSSAMLRELRPDYIVNCAAYTLVDDAESNKLLAFSVNATGPKNLALAAKELDATLVHISTDFVFDGRQRRPYQEPDPTHPLSVYGNSKLGGETAILESGLEKFFIVRTSWLFGSGGSNFVDTIARLSQEREVLRIVCDQVGTPTYTEDLAHAVFQLIGPDGDGEGLNKPYGIYHFSCEGACSWYEFALEILGNLEALDVPTRVRTVLPIPAREYPSAAERPAFSVLSKQKYKNATGQKIPQWQDSLKRYLYWKYCQNQSIIEKG